MKSQLRRPLATVGVLAFGAATGGLAAHGHSPIAIGLVAAVVAFVALLTAQTWSRSRQWARRLTDLDELACRVERGPRQGGDQQVVERVEELERRLLASLDAERQRAAERHREVLGRRPE